MPLTKIPSIMINPTVPTIQRFTSGSGTYTTPAGVKYIRVTAIGAGGGGAGSGTASSAGDGGTGGNTTFGSSLITSAGGIGGVDGGVGALGGFGGASTINGPALTILSASGTAGGSYSQYNVGTTFTSGPEGGAGFNGGGTGRGGSVSANSGSGGAGGGSSAVSVLPGNGGGAGAYSYAQINSPSATYAYTVGAAGTAGTAGTSGFVGLAGSEGLLVIEEYY